jgi:DNA-binding transcriptional LysR family regulator
VEGTFFSNDITLLCEAAVAGLGIALLPQDLVARDLERGALQQVLADVVGTELHIALVYPDRTFLPPQVRAFIDAVVAWVPRRRAVEPGAPTSGQLAASRGSRKQGAAS